MYGWMRARCLWCMVHVYESLQSRLYYILIHRFYHIYILFTMNKLLKIALVYRLLKAKYMDLYPLLFKTRHVFVKHGCPRWQQSPSVAKISKSYILTPPHPQGHVMWVKCEEPIDELTVQVWLLYHLPNFKYCTLFVSGTELRTDRRTDRQTDDPITRCPRRTFRAGGIKRCGCETICPLGQAVPRKLFAT